MSDTMFESLPDDVTIPSSLTADTSADQQASVQMLPFPFCLLFAERPVTTITVAAPSPDFAATTMDQFVRALNAGLAARGYPQNICGWNAGMCR